MNATGRARVRRRRATATIVALGLALAACTGDDTDADALPEPVDQDAGDEPDLAPDEPPDEPAELQLVTEGTLTVCSEASYPPFDQVDEDHPLGYSGLDIELVDAIAGTADLAPITVVQVSFEDIVSGSALADGTCDVGASAIAVTPSRSERLAFTDTYYTSRPSLLAPEEAGIDVMGDLVRGHVLGVQSDTAAADLAAEQVEDAEVRTFDDADELLAAFDDGELDAVLHDLEVMRTWAEDDADVAVVDRATRAARFAFAVDAERDDGLLQLLDSGLEQVRADGTYDELLARHLGVDG